MAGFSDGTLYINQLLVTGSALNTDFSGLLTEVWDFDDQTNRVSNNNLSPVITKNVPVRTYNDPTTDASPKPDPTLIDLPPASWSKYVAALAGASLEVPPLPGQDATIPSDTHHEIRDFMFLDAAVTRTFSNNTVGTGLPTGITFNGITCTLHRIDLGPIHAVEDASAPQVSRGTGPHKRTTGKMLVDQTTVVTNPTNDKKKALGFLLDDVEISFLLYELLDASTGKAAGVEPNWFGVAVPSSATDFSKPILYFHPTPGQKPAHYVDAPDYHAKTAAGPETVSSGGRDWRELFAYVDRLGNQLAGAILQGANPNQILILPFMTSRSASSKGIAFLKQNWLPIIAGIVQDLRSTPI